GTIRFLDPVRNVWTLKAPVEPRNMDIPVEILTDCVLDRTYHADGAVFVQNTSEDALWNKLREASESPEARVYLDTITSSLHLPRRLEREYIGAIFLDSTQERTLNEDTRAYLELLAHHAAVAIKIASIRELAEPLAMMGTMLSDFLHVFRTPLATALSSFELMELPQFPPEQIPEELQQLRTSLDRIRNICSRLELSIARGPVTMDEDVLFNDLLVSVVSDFATRNDSVKVVQQFARPSPVMRGNCLLMEIACKMIV